jgi:hypothetical protein
MRKLMVLPLAGLLALGVVGPVAAAPNVSNTSGGGESVYGEWSSGTTYGYVSVGEDSEYGSYADIYQESGTYVECDPGAAGSGKGTPTTQDTTGGGGDYGFVGTRTWGYSEGGVTVDLSRTDRYGVPLMKIDFRIRENERKMAELARQSEALKSALLASLGHDLRTPLTAIRVAATNLQASWPDERERREQSDLILAEVDRLTRLFHNILEMARIDAGAVTEEMRWVAPSEIVEAARSSVEHALRGHAVAVSGESEQLVRLDPRLTAAALSPKAAAWRYPMCAARSCRRPGRVCARDR